MKKNKFKIYKGKIVKRKFNISTKEIKKFASLTSDHHPIHFDKIYTINRGFADILLQGLFIS